METLFCVIYILNTNFGWTDKKLRKIYISTHSFYTRKKKYSHLMITFSQNGIKEVEMRSNSFFMDEHTILYWPRPELMPKNG